VGILRVSSAIRVSVSVVAVVIDRNPACGRTGCDLAVPEGLAGSVGYLRGPGLRLAGQDVADWAIGVHNGRHQPVALERAQPGSHPGDTQWSPAKHSNGPPPPMCSPSSQPQLHRLVSRRPLEPATHTVNAHARLCRQMGISSRWAGSSGVSTTPPKHSSRAWNGKVLSPQELNTLDHARAVMLEVSLVLQSRPPTPLSEWLSPISYAKTAAPDREAA